MSGTEIQRGLFGDRSPGILLDDDIEELARNGWLVSRNFEPEYMQECSYDLRAGAKGVLGGTSRVIDLTKEALDLAPGAYAGVISFERVRLPKSICARIGAKRAFSYEGIILLTGSIVDPGYEGYLLFGIYNASPHKYPLTCGQKLCNVVFERLERDVKSVPTPDPRLSNGDFPVEFLRSMDRLEVEPLMQVGERVAHLRRDLEDAQKQLGDLRTRNENVLEPIRELTENVNRVTNDVGKLTGSVQELSTQSTKLDLIVSQNNQQITTVGSNLSQVGADLAQLTANMKTLSEVGTKNATKLAELDKNVALQQVAVRVFWALLLLGLGIGLKWLVDVTR